MNKQQKIILWASISIIIAMLLFLCHTSRNGRYQLVHAGGLEFLVLDTRTGQLWLRNGLTICDLGTITKPVIKISKNSCSTNTKTSGPFGDDDEIARDPNFEEWQKQNEEAKRKTLKAAGFSDAEIDSYYADSNKPTP